MLFRERQLMSSFKPGNWVILSSSSDSRSLAQVKETYLDSNKSKLYWPSENSTAVCSEMQYYELWQPEVGEWCWFWNKCMDIDQSPRLAQFHLIVEELQEPMDFPAFYQTKYKTIKLGYLYDFCEPFIGQLPTFIKDQS